MTPKITVQHLCDGGVPITPEPCPVCGATMDDFCGFYDGEPLPKDEDE